MSMSTMEPDGREYLVRHRDNSDHGWMERWFVGEGAAREAREHATALVANPPAGNHFHPAPTRLDLAVFRVERII